jgi:hypothetical protein
LNKIVLNDSYHTQTWLNDDSIDIFKGYSVEFVVAVSAAIGFLTAGVAGELIANVALSFALKDFLVLITFFGAYYAAQFALRSASLKKLSRLPNLTIDEAMASSAGRIVKWDQVEDVQLSERLLTLHLVSRERISIRFQASQETNLLLT